MEVNGSRFTALDLGVATRVELLSLYNTPCIISFVAS